MTATKNIFQAIGEVLRGSLGAAAGAVERYDGDPEMAVSEHLVTLPTGAGSALLFGFTSEEPSERSASGRPVAKRIPVSVIILQIRDGNRAVAEEAARLDDLMDAAEAALEGAGPARYGCINVTYRGRRGLVGGADWLGRVVEYDFIPSNL